MNFRSFDNINVEFHEGVNVLIGHNNSGKSNLLRALAIIFDSSVRKQLSVEDFNNSLTIESNTRCRTGYTNWCENIYN